MILLYHFIFLPLDLLCNRCLSTLIIIVLATICNEQTSSEQLIWNNSQMRNKSHHILLFSHLLYACHVIMSLLRAYANRIESREHRIKLSESYDAQL